MLDLGLVQACSGQMHPTIVNAIVKTESNFNTYAIGVNRGFGVLNRQPSNYQEAVTVAKKLLAMGANIDLGLAQINSANLRWLGLSVEQVFDPCNNLKAMQTVYLSCYGKAGTTGLGTRMQRAFSCYNTGNIRKGFANGYVTKVTTNFNAIANTHFVAKNNNTQSISNHIIANLPNNKPYPTPSTVQNYKSVDGFDDVSSSVSKNSVVLTAPSYSTWDIFKDF